MLRRLRWFILVMATGTLFSFLYLRFNGLITESLVNAVTPKLFDWPIVVSLLVISLALLFFDPLHKIIGRISKIKWGDQEIEFSKVPEELEKMIDSRVEKILAARDENADPARTAKKLLLEETPPNEIMDRIKRRFKVQDDRLAALLYLLTEEGFEWRTMRVILGELAISEEKLNSLVDQNASLIKRSTNRDGETIFAVRVK